MKPNINNPGNVTPTSAAEAAKALGVKIYTIGAGTTGRVPFPMIDPWGRKVYQNVIIEIDDNAGNRFESHLLKHLDHQFAYHRVVFNNKYRAALSSGELSGV